ncbi:MAG TPA: flagellar protein FlaG [Bryobacteraceae bacterium]|nr:flagellar protein FlaG [Bryobacteraceae bacterium]
MEISALNRNLQPVEAAAPVSAVKQPAQARDVVQAVKAVNASEMFGQENELVFQMDRQAKRMVVQIVNRQTKEVISQIPPEYVLRLSEDMKSLEK